MLSGDHPLSIYSGSRDSRLSHELYLAAVRWAGQTTASSRPKLNVDRARSVGDTAKGDERQTYEEDDQEERRVQDEEDAEG